MRMQVDDLAQAVGQFLGHLEHERQSAPNTLAAYQNDLNQFVRHVEAQRARSDHLAPGPFVEATGADLVSSFVLALRERKYAPATVARRIAAVKSFFAWAYDVGLLTKNPVSRLEAPRVARSTPRAVSAHEIQRLIEIGCSGDRPEAVRNRAMLTLLHQTGLRVSELVALNLADIDLAAGTIRVAGRGGRARTVSLGSAPAAALEEYLARARGALARHESGEALFLNNRGGRLTRQGFWLILTTQARRSGVESPVSPHALRNAFAFEQLQNGTALHQLKDLLGHVSITTTRVYARPGPRPTRTVPAASSS